MIVAEISDAGVAEAIRVILERGRQGQLSQKRLQAHYLQNFAHDKVAEAYIELFVGRKQPPVTEAVNPGITLLTSNSIGS